VGVVAQYKKKAVRLARIECEYIEGLGQLLQPGAGTIVFRHSLALYRARPGRFCRNFVAHGDCGVVSRRRDPALAIWIGPFITFGVVAIVSGYIGMTIVPRHYRAAERIFFSVAPTAQRILLELESESDHTCLYATPIDSAAKPRADRMGLLLPIWCAESLLDKPLDVSVYLEPATNRPVAFRTSKGFLWSRMSWQSVG
jgi:hypothetical protein